MSAAETPEAYLRMNPPARSQYRDGRRATPTGCTVIHTAESVLDITGDDTGAEGVANFICTRTDAAGSYHGLVDSDSRIKVVRYGDEAYQDGTGSNPWAMSISFALRAADWPSLSAAKREAFLRMGAEEFAAQQNWLQAKGYPATQFRRITKAQSDAGESGFISHGERDPGRRSDPGADFPWTQFIQLCQLAMTPRTIKRKKVDMFIVDDPNSNAQWICDAHTRRHSMNFDEVLFLAANGWTWFQEVPETIGQRNALLQQRKIVASVPV